VQIEQALADFSRKRQEMRFAPGRWPLPAWAGAALFAAGARKPDPHRDDRLVLPVEIYSVNRYLRPFLKNRALT